MAHTPDYLTLRVSWDHPGLQEALETIIAKAWAEGFRTGVNDERADRGPFGSEAVTARYRDWRGYGPGANHPGGAHASARIRAEDGEPDSVPVVPSWQRETLIRAMDAVIDQATVTALSGLVKPLYVCGVHHGVWPCVHATVAAEKGVTCTRAVVS